MVRVREGVAAGLAAALLVLSSAAWADNSAVTAPADDRGLLALGAGAFDFDHLQPAGELRGEYRFSQGWFFIKPVVGAFGTTRGSVYAYGGLRADLIFFDHYVVMPVETVGYYNRGNGKNLGSPVEFKSGVEFAWRFDNATRLGLAFDHISNAGLTRQNPGTENLLLVYSLPLPGG